MSTCPFSFVRFDANRFHAGPSAFCARLESVFDKIILQLEQAKSCVSDYRQIRPVDIVVLTNSSPSDGAAQVIRMAAWKLSRGSHHPNAVGIQFVQVGNDVLVEKGLQRLSQDPSFVSYSIHRIGHALTLQL